MIHVVKRLLPHPVLFIMDLEHGVLPPTFVQCTPQVVHTASCIVVGTQASVDGEVTVALSGGDPEPRDSSRSYVVFDGTLSTPRRVVQVCTSEEEVLLSAAVDAERVRITIRTDHATQPDFVKNQRAPDLVRRQVAYLTARRMRGGAHVPRGGELAVARAIRGRRRPIK